jgi:hypothetical protein
MIERENYNDVRKVADRLKGYSTATRENNEDYFEFAFYYVGDFLDAIKKTKTFAAQVADTILDHMDPNNHRQVAFISEKQAWVLGCCAVEHNIKFE